MLDTSGGESDSLTEKLLGDFGRFNDFNDTRVQLFNGGHMVSEDTHITRGSSQVDLLDGSGLVDRLDGKKRTWEKRVYNEPFVVCRPCIADNHYLVR